MSAYAEHAPTGIGPGRPGHACYRVLFTKGSSSTSISTSELTQVGDLIGASLLRIFEK